MYGAPGTVAACGGVVGAAAERREREPGVLGDGGYMSVSVLRQAAKSGGGRRG